MHYCVRPTSSEADEFSANLKQYNTSSWVISWSYAWGFPVHMINRFHCVTDNLLVAFFNITDIAVNIDEQDRIRLCRGSTRLICITIKKAKYSYEQINSLFVRSIKIVSVGCSSKYVNVVFIYSLYRRVAMLYILGLQLSSVKLMLECFTPQQMQ